MGTWSHIIKGNDLTLDIISEYYKLFDSEILPFEIRNKLEEEYCPLDENEYSNFWTAIALCQWECGQLEDYVVDKLNQTIKTGYGINYLKDEDLTFYNKRKNELEFFIDKIQSEKKDIKKPKKNKVSEFPNGTVFGFLLPASLGYGYAKYLNYSVEFETTAISRVCQVFNIRTEKLESGVKFLENIDYLFGPRILYKIPNTKGKDAWTIIGEFLKKKDLEYPLFIEKRPNGWLPVDYSTKTNKNYEIQPLEKVLHLEPPTLSTNDMITTRAAMTFLKNSGQSKKIPDLFDLKQDYINALYEQTMEKPNFFEIPDKYKKRPIELSWIDKLKKRYIWNGQNASR